jgi:PBSX family phage portal protein
MEVNVDGTGWEIEPKNPTDPEKTVQGEIDGENKEAIGEEPEEPGKPEVKPEVKPGAKPVKGKEGEEELPEGAKPFKAPPTTPDEVVEQEKEKFEEKEADRLAEEEKAERVQAIKDEEDEQRKGIEDFFNEPWPRMSFTTLRRRLRRDVESVGNAYMEVIRNIKGDIVFLNYLDAKLVRLVRLGKAVQVEEEIERFGKKAKVHTLKRERRFAMLIGGRTTVSNVTKVLYFREFGASREINKWTGLWEGENEKLTESVNDVLSRPASPSPTRFEVQPVPVPGLTDGLTSSNFTDIGGAVDVKDRGTEIIHFTAVPDITTLYGVPRWINQTPSVLGSRKAEELNLEFFNSGGLPPVMILIQGGSMNTASRDALTGYLAGEAKTKQRGVITEVFSTTGDFTSAGHVRISVERFGAEKQQDALFMKYDQSCMKHTRMAFRLPPLFIGDSDEHNFATAQASYMVAEAQVFDPERVEFDEVINTHIMAEIAPEWVFKSTTLSIKDVETQIKALEMAKDSIEKECFVKEISEVAHLDLECVDEADEPADIGLEVANRVGLLAGQPGAVVDGSAPPPFQQVNATGDQFGKIAKLDDNILIDLADDWSAWLDGSEEYSEVSIEAMRQLIDCLAPTVRKVFNGYVAMKMLPGEQRDPDGTADLFAEAGAQMQEMSVKGE